jgi:hypothetical protein
METPQNKQIHKHRHTTCVLFNEHEFEMIQKMRQTTGKSFPELLKQALFRRKELAQPLFDKESVAEIMTELRRQGNNINQIARHINSGMASGWNQSLNALVSAYFQIRHIISVNRGYSTT